MTVRTELCQKEAEDNASLGESRPQLYTLGLFDSHDGQQPQVFITPGFDVSDERICSACSRVSVVYPLKSGEFSVPAASNYSIGFLAPRRALYLLSKLNEQEREIVLFGCGTCSIILVTPDREQILALINKFVGELHAWEIWDVSSDRLTKEENSWQISPLPSVKRIDLQQIPLLSQSTIWLVCELSVNLNHYYQHAHRFAPQVIEEIETLAHEVNELIDEIRADEELQLQAVDAIEQSSQFPEPLRDQFLEAKKRLNTNLDLLVQLNSALVYAVSQAFAGAVPIRVRYPHISQHSLLGTGTAWRAIQRTCSSIFATFRREQFAEKLRDNLDSGGVTTVRLANDPDQVMSELRLNTRVVHFSARSGFGESDAAITCPSQIIQVCDQPEWSLCTATHEILHAHVRELITSIFLEKVDEDTPKPFDLSLAETIEDFRAYILAEKTGNAQQVTALGQLRYGIIEFAISYRASIAKAREKYGIDYSEPDDDEPVKVFVTLPKDVNTTFRAFKKSFRLLEETIVHILDLHYFFGGNKQLFSDSLWNSWSIVPSVMEKLDWYVLRTVLALASDTSGGAYDRLAEAISILSDSLNKVIRRQQGSVVAEEVLKRLNASSSLENGKRVSTPFLKWIDLLFPACLSLVDLSTKFLISRRLLSEFDRQSNGSLAEGEHIAIDLPDFAVDGIADPIALIHDRLRLGLEDEGLRRLTSEEVARNSAWLLLALSSEMPQMKN